MTFSPVWKDEHTDLLAEAILALKDKDEVYRLLDDLCTVNEIKVMAQRVQIARMLGWEKQFTYNEIARTTGASTATISRVKRCLNYGNGGYHTVLTRILGAADDETQDE